MKFTSKYTDPNKLEPKHVFDYTPYYEGKIQIKTCPEFANAIRRILLDEIESLALCCDNATFETNDTTLSAGAIFQMIQMIKPLEFHGKSKSYNLSVKSTNMNEKIPVISNHISAELIPGILICHLSPGCFVKITGITVVSGTGQTHRKFSAVIRNVKYRELDFFYVRKLNDRGFIIRNRFRVSSAAHKHDRIILSNKEWEKLLNEKDKKYFKNFEPVYNFKIIDKSVECENYEISFCSFYDPEIIVEETIKILRACIEKARAATVIKEEDITKFTFDGSYTAGNLLMKYLGEYNVFADNQHFSNYTRFRIVLRHPDAQKVFSKAIDQILSNEIFGKKINKK